MRSISQSIRKFRNRRGLTQKQLAEAAKVALISVRKWEQGVCEPSLSSLFLLATALEVEPAELLAPTEEEVPKAKIGRPRKIVSDAVE